jgi:hypothetical protein
MNGDMATAPPAQKATWTMGPATDGHGEARMQGDLTNRKTYVQGRIFFSSAEPLTEHELRRYTRKPIEMRAQEPPLSDSCKRSI